MSAYSNHASNLSAISDIIIYQAIEKDFWQITFMYGQIYEWPRFDLAEVIAITLVTIMLDKWFVFEFIFNNVAKCVLERGEVI